MIVVSDPAALTELKKITAALADIKTNTADTSAKLDKLIALFTDPVTGVEPHVDSITPH